MPAVAKPGWSKPGDICTCVTSSDVCFILHSVSQAIRHLFRKNTDRRKEKREGQFGETLSVLFKHGPSARVCFASLPFLPHLPPASPFALHVSLCGLVTFYQNVIPQEQGYCLLCPHCVLMEKPRFPWDNNISS